MNKLKLLLRELTPPLLLKTLKGTEKYGYFGHYSSWEEARKNTIGYDADLILQKVKESLLKVKRNQAAYERDSVLFEQIQHSYPLLASLLRIALENQDKLNILDFGGSLGSSYYQCKDFLSILKELKWNIVEQDKFVACGKQYFKDEQLSFFDHIDSCLQVEKPNVILVLSVIQYLEKPYEFLEKLIDYDFDHIIFDRTAFVKKGGDRLTIQKVPPTIYPASYPAWFLNLDKFLSFFTEKYDLLLEFDSNDRANIPSQFKGFYFRKKAL